MMPFLNLFDSFLSPKDSELLITKMLLSTAHLKISDSNTTSRRFGSTQRTSTIEFVTQITQRTQIVPSRYGQPLLTTISLTIIILFLVELKLKNSSNPIWFIDVHTIQSILELIKLLIFLFVKFILLNHPDLVKGARLDSITILASSSMIWLWSDPLNFYLIASLKL